jgi:hypothetical protein
MATALVGKQRFQCFSYDEYPDGLLLHACAAGRGGLCPRVCRGEEVGIEPERLLDSTHLHLRISPALGREPEVEVALARLTV